MHTQKILYIDMDNVLVDFKTALSRTDEPIQKQYEGRLDEIPHLFAKMDPMPGAIDAFTKLAATFDTYILSTAPWENPTAWHDKLEWVKKHLGRPAYKRLILSHHKHLNHGDFLIDDRTKNGADRFKGELILFGSERFPDWGAVVGHLVSQCTGRHGTR